MWILILSHTKGIELALAVSLVAAEDPNSWVRVRWLVTKRKGSTMTVTSALVLFVPCGHDGCLHTQWAILHEKIVELGILCLFITKQHVNCSFALERDITSFLKVLCKLQEMVWESSQGHIFYLCEPSRGNSPTIKYRE